MRYVGCKRRLLSFIHDVMKKHHIEKGIFCDLFAGTATVGNYFKQQGFKIISNDMLYSSYVQQQVRVAINKMPTFKTLSQYLGLIKGGAASCAQFIIDYLNQLNGMEGYIYHHYSPGGSVNQTIQRMYFTDENAKKIDAIRELIEAWRQLDLICRDEFYILLYALLEAVSKRSNTTATQTSFLKHFDQSALKTLFLVLPEITAGDVSHSVCCENALDLINKLENVDVLYLDPPYTRKQYFSAYHLLETIARWDYPIVYGISGIPKHSSLISTFSHKKRALSSLKKIVSQKNYRHLLLSYSSDSLVPHDVILSLLKDYGEVQVYSQPLPRYISMSQNDKRRAAQKYVAERLYYVKPYLRMSVYLNTNIHSEAPIVLQ